MGDSVIIDGSHEEGGGQILRSALALSAITGRLLKIERLRAGRPNPGLAAQHVTAVLSVAELCRAEVAVATLGSEVLSFRPTAPPRAGDYFFDVAAAREGGSAGAATLVLQTVALVALFAGGSSRFCIRGGTHVLSSPPYDYIAQAWRPFLARIGVLLELGLPRTRDAASRNQRLRDRAVWHADVHIEGQRDGPALLSIKPTLAVPIAQGRPS